MGLFSKKKDEPVKPVKCETCLDGLKKLEEAGFLPADKKEVSEDFAVPSTYAYSEGYLFGSELIEGSAKEQLEKIESFIKKCALQSDLMPKRGKVYNYDMSALMDLIAFLMANRDVESEDIMNIACVKEGIEVAVKAEVTGLGLMEKSFDEAMEALAENGNGYPIVTFEDGDLILAVNIHPFFKKPSEVRSNAKLAGMMFGGFAGVDALDRKVLKFLK